jgi:hypothetical protein
MVAAAHSMSFIRLDPTDDRELAARVITDPEMWERVSEDGQEREEFNSEDIPEDWIILAVRTPHGTAGVYLIHEAEAGIWQMHANILEPFRSRYAAESGAQVMVWIDQNLPESAEMAMVIVPVIYPDVMGFVQRYGFRDMGATTPSMKNGEEIENRLLMVPRGGWV